MCWLVTCFSYLITQQGTLYSSTLPMSSLSQSRKQANSPGWGFMAVETLVFISYLVSIKAWEFCEITLPCQNLLRSVWKFSCHLIFSFVCLGEHGDMEYSENFLCYLFFFLTTSLLLHLFFFFSFNIFLTRVSPPIFPSRSTTFLSIPWKQTGI